MTRLERAREWEVITGDLSRIQVPGGWLYRAILYNADDGDHIALSFVPYPADWDRDAVQRAHYETATD
jgi:hypothetical protein